MPAKVYIVPREDNDAVLRLLAGIEEGGIVVTDSAAEAYRERFGHAPPTEMIRDYDWGGEPDVLVDVVYADTVGHGGGSWGLSALLRADGLLCEDCGNPKDACDCRAEPGPEVTRAQT
jgi:hypothetical protein